MGCAFGRGNRRPLDECAGEDANGNEEESAAKKEQRTPARRSGTAPLSRRRTACASTVATRAIVVYALSVASTRLRIKASLRGRAKV